MDLPRPLHSWRPYLALFPRDIALSLGPLLQRLAAAVGPVSARQSAEGGALEGFAGLTRRGSYERLLPTEWLLADEAPLEFLRRAVQGEHAFFDIARPKPQGGRMSVAAFDTGPSQLGSPRIAQLALLIVLARRAEAAGVRFSWGILQDPGGPLFPNLTEAGVLRLLEARTAREATAGDLAAWEERVGGWSELDDLWVIGGDRLARLPRLERASRIEIRDPLETDARRVDVTVHLGGTRTWKRRAVALELPPEPTATRLLRDPFLAALPESRRVHGEWAPLSNLIFSGNGARLFARAAGGIVSYAVPRSAHGSPLPVHTHPWPEGERLAGIGFARREVILAAVRQGQVSLHAAHKNGGVHWGGSYHDAEAGKPFAEPAAEDPLSPCFRIGERTFLLDGERSLFELLRPTREMTRLATGVSAWTHYAGGLALLTAADGETPARILRLGFEPGRKSWPKPVALLDRKLEGGGNRAFFGFGGKGLSHADYGCLASERDDGNWALLFSQGTLGVVVPPGSRPVGVGRSLAVRRPGLVVLEADGRTLTLLCPGAEPAPLFTAAAPVEEAVVSHAGPHLALCTTGGEVTMISLDSQTVIGRWVPEGGR